MVLCAGRLALVSAVALVCLAAVSRGQLQVGFYSNSCPNVESSVKSVITKHFQSDPTIAPAIVRMFFHDCFVRGCDGSVLLDGPSSEKTAVPNLSLRGFDAIDDAKTQLEAACPGVVSCADILALAARDLVVLTQGRSWAVETGRRDGRISQANDTLNLPSPTDDFVTQKNKFLQKGLDTNDLVALVGAHTIGTAACRFISYRLYNYNNTGNPDPTINRIFLRYLQTQCPQGGDPTKRVPLDNVTPGKFDNNFYLEVATGSVVLESDQRLFSSIDGQIPVVRLALMFGGNDKFGKAMVKMGRADVLTGTQGEIRNVCSKVN